MRQLPLLFFGKMGCCVQHFVGALAVTAHIIGQTPPDVFLQVFEAHLLRLRFHEADHEILFPTGYGTIRTAEGDVSGFSIQMEGHGTELGGHFGEEALFEIADDKIAEPLGHDGIANEIGHGFIRVGGHHFHRSAIEPFVALPKGIHFVLPIQPREFPIGQGAEHQIVHLVEGADGKGDVGVPADIIEYAVHIVSLG